MKRLTKSSHDRKVSGVCGGLAEYFGIDPAIIRILFGIAFFVYGSGLIPYIILSIVLPYDYEVDGQVTARRAEPRDWGSKVSNWTSRDNSSPKDVTPDVEDDWSDF